MFEMLSSRSTPTDDTEPGHAIARSAELVAANINPRTGLATDYLNHFNEAMMLLEMIPDVPECAQEFLAWRPLSYAEHFRASNLDASGLAVAAYRDADPATRAQFDAVTTAMTTILAAVATAMRGARHSSTRVDLARLAVASVKPMVMLAGHIVNGTTVAADDHTAHAAIDDIMSR